MKHWFNTIIILRGDAHFCSKELMDWSENIDTVDFITGFHDNSKLNQFVQSVKEEAESRFHTYGKSVKRYHFFIKLVHGKISNG